VSAAASAACPRCHARHPGAVRTGVPVTCDTCGLNWTPGKTSDEYLPEEGSGAVAVPLTERRAPPPRHDTPGELPFDRLEREAARGDGVTTRPMSDLAFRPSTDNLHHGGRTHCPVCGHGFTGAPGADEQRCPACGTAFVPATGRLTAASSGQGGDPLIGRVLRGCRIDRKLGEGGMGAVYHANQISLDRSVAIKVLPPELARNRNFIQRFEREAKSLARINHANILQIYDFGEDPALGIYFMVIEFVDGWDLGEVLRRQPTLSQVETLDIVRQALLGLEQAADKGVIHRDIKPDNLMVSLGGLCKVSDFGLAKGQASGSEVTSVGVRVGTPAFMSPEQCDGVEVDARSDVYNLGCTAYLMLTGRLPYDGETPFSIMLKHKVDPVPSARTVLSSIDPQVDGLLQRMMAKRPDDRCGDLHELIDEAERLLVALTGTHSVLRKTNGPIRALVEAAANPDAAARRVRERAVSHDPLPGARPSGRQRVVPGSEVQPPVIPEWLKPVDMPAGSAPPAPTPAPPPAAAARTGPQPAIGSRTGPQPAIGSRTGPQAAIGSRAGPAPAGPLHTPFPGADPPSERRSAPSASTALASGAIDRVRERGIRAEVASIAAGAERLASGGSLDQAASEWRRASQLARDPAESRRLQELATDAQRRAKRRRVVRGLLIGAASAALVAVNLWLWPPVVHNLVAERERARLGAIAQPEERSRRLREFAAANQGGWRWYRTLFGRGYEVPAAAAAALDAERAAEPPAPPGRQAATTAADPRAPSGVQAVVALAEDPRAPWGAVIAAAKPLAADPRAAEVLARAEAAIESARALRSRLDVARIEGRHGEALDLAGRLRTEHARAGTPASGLPRAGRLRIVDADTATPIDAPRVAVDGVELQPGEQRVCLSATGETRIEVAALGYALRRMAVPPADGDGERVVEVALAPAALWRRPAPAARPAWTRLHPVGTAVVALRPDLAAIYDPASGAERVLTVAGTALSPWWATAEGGWQFATADGEVRQLGADLARALPVRRLPADPRALLDIDLVYRAGGRLALSVEVAHGAAALVARDGGREAWRHPAAAAHQPLLRRSDDKILLVDDLAARTVEEDGVVSATFAFTAPRSGAWAELPGERLVVATAAGIEVVAWGRGGPRLVASPGLAAAGPALPAAVGQTLLLARSTDRSLEAYDWSGETPRPLWRSRLPARPVLVWAADGIAVVGDESGGVVVVGLADGEVIRRIAHGPAAVAVAAVRGHLVIADQTGALAAYRLP
jgi:tRNA A-37 threonylcarbamoyl transferase component Bud32